MNFIHTKKIESSAVLVFLTSGLNELKKNELFKSLKKADADVVQAYVGKDGISLGVGRLIHLPSGKKALLIGKEKENKFTARKSLLAARRIISLSRKEGLDNIQVSLDDLRATEKEEVVDLARRTAIQFEMANFEFNSYKTVPEGGWKTVKKAFIFSAEKGSLSESLSEGAVIGQEINATRVLANTPASDMTPAHLAAIAVSLGKKYKFPVRVLKEVEMKKLGMGGVLGVGQGSLAGPRFIIMEYLKGPKNKAPVVLAGKGITFDSGGLNLKPSDHIYEMHMDMSGGAAVMHTIAALARLKAKVNVVALIPAAENMVSGSSYRPGDVLKTMSGKTIEVMNTDAEGRVVLADALTYALRYKPRLVIDVATLTGAAMVALGQRASALFSTDRIIEDRLRMTGEATGDFVWPMPLWEEYEDDVKAVFGDVANVSKSRYGGAINGAVFLWQFIKDQNWVHIDIAPRMTATGDEYLAKGAAGAGVNLLVHFLEKF